MPFIKLLVGFLVVLALAPGPAAAGAPARKVGHPPTGADPATQDCVDCHQEATPQVFKAWNGSRHGEALVKCLVCHGDAGKSFVRIPKAVRCAGCHAAQVASVARKKGPSQTCFSCHDPHALTPAPHRASPHTR